MRSRQLQRLEVGATANGRRRRRQILGAIVRVAFVLGQLIEGGCVLAMEEGHVDVGTADGSECKEQDITVNGMCSVDAARLKLVSLSGQSFDRCQQVVTAQGRDDLLNDTAWKCDR